MSNFGSPGFKTHAQKLAEAKALRAKRIRIGAILFGLVAATVFAMGWNPPEGSVHAYTTLSDYNSEKESGCVNSGDGCHGEESSYTSFNDYHPNAECTDCHEYQGVGCIPCHTPEGTECTSCHDGSMKNAGDRTRITDPYPRGHYSETTHTALGTDMKRVMTVVEDGESSATCKDCHSRDLLRAHQGVPKVKGSKYGSSIGCGECHNDTRAKGLKQVQADWTKDSCEDCHDGSSSCEMHDAEIAPKVKGAGKLSCGSTGIGCHEGNDIHALHPDAPTTCAGSEESDEPGCHDFEKQAAKPEVISCGGTEDDVCHAEYENEKFSHAEDKDVHLSVLSSDAYSVVVEGRTLSESCDACHDGELATEHARAHSAIASADEGVCRACHNASDEVAAIVKQGWAESAGSKSCTACHDGSTLEDGHLNEDASEDTAHAARELDASGASAPDSCSASTCHGTTDVRLIHRDSGCAFSGCHGVSGAISPSGPLSCGGKSSSDSCHAGVYAKEHATSHAADPADKAMGCFGCHRSDLLLEHSTTLAAGVMEGGATTTCRICHDDELATGVGAYADATSVKSAVASGSTKCASCHKSGTSKDGAAAVASAHKAISAQNPLPAGTVWADPAEDWKTALNATTGGGHNTLSASAVGASKSKKFPVTSFTLGGVTRVWPLPKNEATTTWLQPSRYPSPSVDTTTEIQMLKVTCGDCHAGTESMAGPQGASVKVRIDSGYSQTEYASPSPNTYQFDPYNLESVNNSDNPVGYLPVICVKCHTVTARVNPNTGLIAYGGTRYHGTHASRHTIPWAGRREACIDCHVRIPHAWRRPRLLISTVTTGGAAPDAYPYVQQGHTGLVGLRLLETTDPTKIVGRDTCATGGCYSQHYAAQTPPRVRSEGATEHPTPSNNPTATYWP